MGVVSQLNSKESSNPKNFRSGEKGKWSGSEDESESDPFIESTKTKTTPSRDREKTSRLVPKPLPRFLCLVLIAIAILLLFTGAVALAVYTLQMNTVSGEILQTPDLLHPKDQEVVVGCDQLEVEDVWVTGVPQLRTQSCFRLLDINFDGILDAVIGFATIAEGGTTPDIQCDIYFGGVRPCFGGVLALNGMTGRELWRHYSGHEIFALNCNVDFNGDGVKDCMAGGKAEVFEMISGRDGSLLWQHSQEDWTALINFYTSQPVDDQDSDGVPEVLAAHGGGVDLQPGRLYVFSGRTGEVLSWMEVPDKAQTYYSPQVYYHPGATQMVIFGTGGETRPGALYVIPLKDLYKGDKTKAKEIYRDQLRGIMTPPALYDLTGDGVKDIITNPYNSSVFAFDGLNYSLIWKYTIPLSETYSTPALGYYNEDQVPDVFAILAIGPGFPIYNYSHMTILDGSTGVPLLPSPIRSSLMDISSPLAVSVEGFGNDLFLYQFSDCLGYEGQGWNYSVVKGTVYEKINRYDVCSLLYNTTSYDKQVAISRNIPPPGVTIYYSDERRSQLFDSVITTTEYINAFLEEYPQYKDMYQKFTNCNQQREQGQKCTDDLSTLDVYSPPAHQHQDGRHRRQSSRSQPSRKKRHIGIHDGDGTVNLSSTGSLAPTSFPVSHPDYNHSIDLLFAIGSMYEYSKSKGKSTEEAQCVWNRYLNEIERFDPKSPYFGQDDDEYTTRIRESCLGEREKRDLHVRKNSTIFNPFDVPMGQLTIFRLRLKCKCSGMTKLPENGRRCSRILPFEQQHWAAYMGSHGDSHWLPG